MGTLPVFTGEGAILICSILRASNCNPGLDGSILGKHISDIESSAICLSPLTKKSCENRMIRSLAQKLVFTGNFIQEKSVKWTNQELRLKKMLKSV